MSAIRRGGTLSISASTLVLFRLPLGDLFDMQVQIRMGQANVRRGSRPDAAPGRRRSPRNRRPHDPRDALEDAPLGYEIFQKKQAALSVRPQALGTRARENPAVYSSRSCFPDQPRIEERGQHILDVGEPRSRV